MILLLLLLALTQQPTFRASSVTVEVDVVVTDDKGVFVGGLTPRDFVVEEEGDPQTIDTLRLVSSSRVGSADANATRPEASAGSTTVSPAPRRFVWVFDDLHTTPGGFTRVRDGLVQSIRTDLQPGDVGGIVVTGFSSGLQLTSDRDVLLEGARKLRASAAQQSRRAFFNDWPRFTSDEEAMRVVAGDRSVFDEVFERAKRDEPELCDPLRGGKIDCGPMVHERARQIESAARQTAYQTLGILQAVTKSLATLPGRSTVIIATEGFLTPEMRAEMDRIEQTAADARVTIYAIDSRGLRESGHDIVTGAMQGAELGGLSGQRADPLDGGINGLASVTGGRVIRNQNRFDRVFAEIVAEASRYYVLAYRPRRGAEKEEWRRITVRVNRPGLRVAARRGYRARPERSTTAETVAPSPASSEPPPPIVRVPIPDVETVSDDPVPVITKATPREEAPALIAELRAAARRATPLLVEQQSTAAWEAYQRGDVETARKNLAGVGGDDLPAWASYVLGLSEFALGHTAPAAVAWERVRTLAPGFQAAYFDLVDAYITSGEFRRALDVLRAAASRWPEDAEVWNATGVVELRRGSVDDAVAAFEKATRAAPRDGLGFYNLGRALEIRYQRARRWSRIDQSWASNRADLAAAVFAYERAVALGGQTQQSAKEALARLAQ